MNTESEDVCEECGKHITECTCPDMSTPLCGDMH